MRKNIFKCGSLGLAKLKRADGLYHPNYSKCFTFQIKTVENLA